jgi:hypothetical protein
MLEGGLLENLVHLAATSDEHSAHNLGCNLESVCQQYY